MFSRRIALWRWESGGSIKRSFGFQLTPWLDPRGPFLFAYRLHRGSSGGRGSYGQKVRSRLCRVVGNSKGATWMVSSPIVPASRAGVYKHPVDSGPVPESTWTLPRLALDCDQPFDLATLFELSSNVVPPLPARGQVRGFGQNREDRVRLATPRGEVIDIGQAVDSGVERNANSRDTGFAQVDPEPDFQTVSTNDLRRAADA